MKKISSFFLFSFIAQAVCAEGFNGFSFGGNIGINSFQSGSASYQGNLPLGPGVAITIGRSRENASNTLFSGGITAGYGTVIQQFFLGGALDFSFSDGIAKIGQPDINVYEKFREKFFLRPVVKLGYVYDSKILFFTSVGASYGYFSIYTDAGAGTSTGVTRGKCYLWAFSVGGGTEIFLNSKVSTTLEYVFNNYQGKIFNLTGSTTGDQVSFTPRDHIFRIGLSYHF